MKYVIVGAGMAGTTAAEEIRKIDKEGSIVLLSEEPHRLYSRVLLPHYIKGKIERERVFLKKPDWYLNQNIEFYPSVTVTKLDLKNRFVATSDGREHEYDKLLLATGGEVETLGGEPRGVSYFRTLDDADQLLQLLNEQPTRAGIIGGGFIALEYINIFADRKIPADLFLRGDRFFGKVLDEDSSALIREKAEADGIVVHTNAIDVEMMGEKTLTGVRVGSKEYPLTMLGVGIGIRPDLAWIKEAGVEVQKGIVANAYLETNVPDVFTAGDIAEYDDLIGGRRLITGNWMNATMQGRTVGKTMTGERTAFELVSSYSTNCRGMEIIFIGDTDRGAAERVVVEGSKAEGGVVQLFVRDERVVGATLVNRNHERARITAMIKNKEHYV